MASINSIIDTTNLKIKLSIKIRNQTDEKLYFGQNED